MDAGNPLDNPFWHALNGPQAALALEEGAARRYPADIAPFLALASSDALDEADQPRLARLAAAGYYCLGVLPALRPRGWHLEIEGIVQMLGPEGAGQTPEDARDPDCRLLGPKDAAPMQALTAIAFPDFFRARTRELGRYVGVFQGGQLVAMAGERSALPGQREISAVCTHPDFIGRGFARRAMRRLMAIQAASGIRPYLHVSAENAPARRLYESLGFTTRVTLAGAKLVAD